MPFFPIEDYGRLVHTLSQRGLNAYTTPALPSTRRHVQLSHPRHTGPPIACRSSDSSSPSSPRNRPSVRGGRVYPHTESNPFVVPGDELNEIK